MSKERNINGMQQFAMINIPWTIDWEALEITEENDKKEFVDNFIKNIKHKPLISYDPMNPDDENESTIGMVEDIMLEENNRINLLCSMWLLISPEYDMVSNNDNMNEPLGLRLNPSGICIQFDSKLNETYISASNISGGFATQIRKLLDKSFPSEKQTGDNNG